MNTMNETIPTAIKETLELRDLVPSEHVNKVMTNLVNSVIYDKKTAVASIEPALQATIRTISSNAETEMEKYWAQVVIDAEKPHEALQDFPYIENYSELTERELRLASETGLTLDQSCTALIIGSGPLPLSAFEIHKQTGAHIEHVDGSEEAIALSKAISAALQIDARFYCAMGDQVALTGTYELVLIAALAGSSVEDKQRIVNNILPHLAPNGRIIIRSAKGNRELLYPVIDAAKLTGVRLLSEYHPTDHIINSVLIYERAL